MRLYVDSNFCSPYAMSSFVALREKGQSFELRRVDLARIEHHDQTFAQLSLTRKVPVLVDNGFLKPSERPERRPLPLCCTATGPTAASCICRLTVHPYRAQPRGDAALLAVVGVRMSV